MSWIYNSIVLRTFGDMHSSVRVPESRFASSVERVPYD